MLRWLPHVFCKARATVFSRGAVGSPSNVQPTFPLSSKGGSSSRASNSIVSSNVSPAKHRPCSSGGAGRPTPTREESFTTLEEVSLRNERAIGGTSAILRLLKQIIRSAG